MTPDPEYTISILCHNRLEMTQRCLDSVRLHSPGRTQILVTDNGSRDDTRDYLRELQGREHRLEVVWNPENLGVGAPKRQAVSLARGPYFVSLDNDAWVGPGWLPKLRAVLDSDPKIGQVGRTGTCQHLSNDGEGRPGGPLEYVDGSAFMVPTELVRQFDICDPLYAFAYCDDSDFSLRIRAHGYQLATVPAPVWHRDGEDHKGDHGGVNLSHHNHQSRLAFCHRWLDYLGRRAFDPTVALRRTGALGDVLLCTPLASRIKQLWPQSTIFFGTDFLDAVRDHPAVDHVVSLSEWDKLYVAYSWNLDGAYEQNLAQNYARSYIAATGLFADSIVPPVPEFRVAQSAREHMRRILEPDGRPLALVCLQGTTWPGKNVDPSRWRRALEWLKGRGYRLVEVGTGEPTCGLEASLMGRTSIREVGALLERAHLFLGVEAGLGHLAQALGTVCCLHFGCTAPAMVGTRTDRLIPVSAENLDCIGCHHHQAPAGCTAFRGCPRGDLACARPDPDRVLQAVRQAAELAEELWGDWTGERSHGR